MHAIFQVTRFQNKKIQARRQEFPEGGWSTHVASPAPRFTRCSYGRGFGAAQDPQKLWGIWSKILKSCNFQALHSSCFSKLIIWFSPNFTPIKVLILKKKPSTLIVLICFQGGGGGHPNPSNPPPPPRLRVWDIHVCTSSFSRFRLLYNLTWWFLASDGSEIQDSVIHFGPINLNMLILSHNLIKYTVFVVCWSVINYWLYTTLLRECERQYSIYMLYYE